MAKRATAAATAMPAGKRDKEKKKRMMKGGIFFFNTLEKHWPIVIHL